MHKMNLTKDEKKVLSLLNDEPAEGFENFAQAYINISKQKIKKIIEKLKKLGLVEIISLKNKDDL